MSSTILPTTPRKSRRPGQIPSNEAGPMITYLAQLLSSTSQPHVRFPSESIQPPQANTLSLLKLYFAWAMPLIKVLNELISESELPELEGQFPNVD